MTMIAAETDRKFLAADRVWIATALLQREQPEQEDFSESDIVGRGRREGFVEERSNTFAVHVNQHCVANRRPNPGNHRMLFETQKGRRRLYRESDPSSPGRTGKVTPNPEDIPAKYHPLLAWYAKWSRPASGRAANRPQDPLLALRGSGRRLWKDQHADDYVRSLREGWE
ncbi:MAG TPA: hypothetical protein VHZ09_02215 [Acidobacteriaceae bacterium]|jgi:hypothetical protein|nr:hypothetical protein [Acidobacteriaceae bacterium]